MAGNYPFDDVSWQRAPVFHGHNVYFVDSADALSSNNPSSGSWTNPFSTLAYAAPRMTAGMGSVIYLRPGHAEAVSSATALALNVAGVTIIGLGHGLNRPTITLNTATTATVSVTAANILVKNVVFSANFADIVSLFTLAAADDFCVEGCLFKATATDMNFLHIFDTGTVDASVDGLTFHENEWFEPDAATLAFGLVDCAIDRLRISKNLIVNGAATVDIAALLTIATGKNLTNLRITDNDLYITGNASTVVGLLITTDGTTGTGIIARNNLKHLDATTEILITTTHKWGLFDNKASAVFNSQGYPLPAIDA